MTSHPLDVMNGICPVILQVYHCGNSIKVSELNKYPIIRSVHLHASIASCLTHRSLESPPHAAGLTVITQYTC